MSIAFYGRVSTDMQSDTSIDDQARLCQIWLDKNGLGTAVRYSDHAISGASLLRPGIQSLLDDCLNGKITMVIAEALDRISRDQEDIAGFFKRLQFAGVKLITLSEGEVTHLHIGLKGTMNQLFLKDLADKTRRGLRGRVEAGFSGGGNSYGYDVVHGADGERGERRINTQEAEVINRIFKDYASGLSPRRIAFALNDEGIPGPSGKAWGPSTINGNAKRGTGILNNELYIGRMVWNRLRYIKDPDTGKRVSKLNPKVDWVIQEMPDLRIVSQELWDAVKDRQQKLTKNTRPDVKEDKPFWERTRPKYLLSGLMKCGCCGGTYTKISANLFGCATARNKGTCNNRVNMRTDHIETMIVEALQHELMDPELYQVFVEAFTQELEAIHKSQNVDIETHRTELSRIECQIDKLVMAIAEGANAKALNTKITELESRQSELQSIIDHHVDTPKPLIHPNLANLYRRKVAHLADLLQHPTDKQQAFELIRGLIDEVRLTPSDDGGLDIELKGELAGVLSLCHNDKSPDHKDRDFAKQVKMVAGARL